MSSCVFPHKYPDGCDDCPLAETCKTRHEPERVKVVCSRCGFELVIFEKAVPFLTNCPVCGNEYP
jgi:ribosomal protein S27E